jgi:alginate O-acetyltransferase complex protein AlgI
VLFNSLEFIVFLIVVYGLYRVMNLKAQNTMLLCASYFFYGWWDVRFLFLVVISTAIDFCAGLLIDQGFLSLRKRITVSVYALLSAFFFVTLNWKALERTESGWVMNWDQWLTEPFGWWVLGGTAIVVAVANVIYPWVAGQEDQRRRRTALILSMTSNLTILGFFKYFNFFLASAQGAAQAMGFDVELLRLNIILPVGISFYTFQSMSYAIDIYRRELKASESFLDFALFVSYFPQLVAGPIERATHLLPSVIKPRRITLEQSLHGFHLILLGLFKKIAIADGVAVSVDQAYGSTGFISTVDIVVGTILFAVQIYCDFSGYSDVARGVSNLFGIELMVNFRTPYFSKDPREFWQKWHISLSTWLRDYLYIPLGGNRGSEAQTYRNLMLTMGLGGLWHGAAWNFILWGIYQGGILCIHRFWVMQRGVYKATHWLYNAFAILLFQPFILYGWLLFRARSFPQIVTITGKLFAFSSFSFGLDLPRFSALVGIPVLLVFDTFDYSQNNNEYAYHNLPAFVRGGLYASMIVALCLGLSNAPAQFIYFDF